MVFVVMSAAWGYLGSVYGRPRWNSVSMCRGFSNFSIVLCELGWNGWLHMRYYSV